MEKKAILFDFDGVLAETMEDLFLAWEKAFENYGVNIKKEDYFPLEGTKVNEIARIISQKYNIKIDSEEIVKLKNEIYLKNHSFRFYPGVIELIDKLQKKKIKIGMVSASQKHKLEKTVPKDFLEKFNVIISGDDTIKGKPDSEPYLAAADKLGINKTECIVIENAPIGVKAAKNADMFCIGIMSTVSKDVLKEADIVIDKFSDLNNLKLINEMIN